MATRSLLLAAWMLYSIIHEIQGTKSQTPVPLSITTTTTTQKPDIIYKPTWESLDARPVPEWYDDVKFGIFLHWGVYSVPSFGSEWFWSNLKGGSKAYVKFMLDNYPPGFTYQNFAPSFRAEFFDPDQWAELFHNSGAKYIVLTSKHHEGFTMWPSSRAFSWNAMDVGPHRDLLGDLAAAVRKKDDMHFGVYYSLYEWFNPMYLQDKNSMYKNQTYVYEKFLPEIVELINNYKPEVLWTDGDWEATDDYWKSKEFLAWLFNESPVKDKIVVNDRWGSGIPCHHGGVYTCADRYNPGVLQKHKWENCMTVDKESWGYRRDIKYSDILSIQSLIKELASTVSCGGNLLMNVGPTKEGTIVPIFQERLTQMGQWLKINGDAIYKTTPWIHQNDTLDGNVWYTQSKVIKGDSPDVFAIVLEWPENGALKLGGLNKQLYEQRSKIYMVGSESQPLKWTDTEKYVEIQMPLMSDTKSQWAWSLRVTNVKTFKLNNDIYQYMSTS